MNSSNTNHSFNNTSSNSINLKNTVNIICLSKNETESRSSSQQISGQKIDINGLYTSKFNDYYLIVYPRWPNCPKTLSNTTVSDAIVITAESKDDYNEIHSYLMSKERINLLIFWTNCNDLKEEASKFKNGKFLSKKDYNINDLRDKIINETIEYSKTIRDIFNTLDTDKSGYLEKKEILNFARDKGDNVSSQEFMDTLNLIDRHGLGKICFEDFEKWWKMGGHTNSLFGRLIKISDFSNKIIINDEKFQLLKSELNYNYKNNLLNYSCNDKNLDKDRSSQLFKFFSNKKISDNPGFQFFFNILIGGNEKDAAKITYLKKFDETLSKKLLKENSTWFQICFTVEQNEALKVANTLKFLREQILSLIEKFNRSYASFIRSFFEIEVKVVDNKVLLLLKLKIDLQDFFENAVLPLLQFFDLFTCSEESTSQFLIDLQTELKLEDIFNKNLNIKEAFECYAFEVKTNLIRSNLRKISKTFKFEYESNIILWFLTAADNVDLSTKLEIQNLIEEKFSNFKLGFIGEIINFYIDKYESFVPFIKKINQIEFALNFNKLFIDVRAKIK